MRALVALFILLAAPLRAGTLQDILAPRATPTPAPPPTAVPTATPTPYGWTAEDAEAERERQAKLDGQCLFWTALGLSFPYWGPMALAGKHEPDRRFQKPWAPQPLAAQASASAGWPGAVHEGAAQLRLSWMLWGLEADWQRLQETLTDGSKDELNQYQFLADWRFVDHAGWRGHTGLGLGLLSALNTGRPLYGGLHYSYELERRLGSVVLRAREDLGWLNPLFYSSSKGTLGWQWSSLELFAGWQYRDYSGVGLSGPLAGALGTF